jgi:hypothetical protein
MATQTKKTKKSKRDQLTKAQIKRFATIRRKGGTWEDVSQAAGFRLTSTGWREVFETQDFDRFGRPGGKGESKARGKGSAAMNGGSAK